MQAIIVKLTANQIVVFFQGQTYQVFAPGKWKFQNIVLRPGDKVILRQLNNEYQISEFVPRINALDKPKVANVDNLIILQSLVDPVLNWSYLMKTLAFYEYKLQLVPYIVFTKADLVPIDKSTALKIQDLKQLGYSVYIKNHPKDFDELKSLFDNKLSCLVGQSGVGKSTFINDLDPTFMRQSGEVSKKLKRGKNTTTQTELISFCGGFLADTPGYSKFINHLTPDELSTAFHDYASLKLKCKFSNCLHVNETHCMVRQKVNENHQPEWRYELYLKILNELKLK